MNAKRWLDETMAWFDARDAEALGARLSDGVWLRCGNGRPVLGRDHAVASLHDLFQALSTWRTTIDRVVEAPDWVGAALTLDLVSSDGSAATIPAFVSFAFRGGQVTRLQLFGELASVFGDAPPLVCDASGTDPVDRAGRETFPASDAPSWTPGTVG